MPFDILAAHLKKEASQLLEISLVQGELAFITNIITHQLQNKSS
jgi:hypothetical protein